MNKLLRSSGWFSNGPSRPGRAPMPLPTFRSTKKLCRCASPCTISRGEIREPSTAERSPRDRSPIAFALDIRSLSHQTRDVISRFRQPENKIERTKLVTPRTRKGNDQGLITFSQSQSPRWCSAPAKERPSNLYNNNIAHCRTPNTRRGTVSMLRAIACHVHDYTQVAARRAAGLITSSCLSRSSFRPKPGLSRVELIS